jgi:prevent-host-death family protein
MSTIAQRELRNRSGEILREAEAGEWFTITVGGRPVAEIGPCSGRQWVSRAEVRRAFAGLPPDRTLARDTKRLGGSLKELGDPWLR